MKKVKVKHIIAIVILVIMIMFTVVPHVMALSNTVGCDYNIPTGKTTWNGKENTGGLWDIGAAGEKRYNISVLTQSRTMTVHGSLYYVNSWASDTKVLDLSIYDGTNGDWVYRFFNSVYGHAYYAKLTAASTAGVDGRTSVTDFT